ncbi:hypothetical protein GYMLUDRAFT_241030 [Collybiopsis luxurians FD-317 M1]|nr:hypothetical protein GYMLUDRAFT_241030 [Collybiopsis luxurians FD-317 M1]
MRVLCDDHCNGADHLDVTSRICSIATAPQTQDACLIFILSASQTRWRRSLLPKWTSKTQSITVLALDIRLEDLMGFYYGFLSEHYHLVNPTVLCFTFFLLRFKSNLETPFYVFRTRDITDAVMRNSLRRISADRSRQWSRTSTPRGSPTILSGDGRPSVPSTFPFPLPSMEWYRHHEPPTSATAFLALNIGSPAHIVQNVLSSPSTFLGLSRLPFWLVVVVPTEEDWHSPLPPRECAPES